MRPTGRGAILTACVYLSLFTLSPATTAASDVIALLLRDGEEALAKDRFGEAVARFNEALQLDWNLPRAYDLLQKTRQERAHALLVWEGQAREAESRRDWETARFYYGRILEEDTARADLRDRLTRLGRRSNASEYIRTGLEKFIADDFAGAQLDFEQALAVSPGDTLALRYLDRVRQKIEGSGALAAIQANTVDWTEYLDALKRFREGDLPAAERIWTGLLTRYPGNESILSNLEQVRRRLGRDAAIATDE